MSNASIGYCLCHTLILTRRCAYRCGYCDYPAAPSRPLPSPKGLERSLRRAQSAGVLHVQLSAGEGIANQQETITALRYFGMKDYTDYLKFVCRHIAKPSRQKGLLPVPHVGNLSLSQLKALRPYVPCIKLCLESADPKLMFRSAHAQAECKAAEKRLEALLEAGRAKIPVTSGILVGIGESRGSRERTLRLLGEVHRRYSHIQNIVIEPFRPRPGTPMADSPAPAPTEIWEAVAIARKIFGKAFPITYQGLMNPSSLNDALEAGVNDLGDVEVAGEPAADIETLRLVAVAQAMLAARGVELRERLPIFPSHLSDSWLAPHPLGLASRPLAPAG